MRKLVLLLILVVLIPNNLILSEKTSEEELPPRFKIWLEEEVGYIISPREKEVFQKLQSDREREFFMEAFWKQRDPTPGTPENEFRTEHYRRIQYANHTYGRSTVKPGWKTDRGRIYIILGDPRDIERYTGDAQIFNSEVWFFQGLTQYGLPTGFNLVFFQKNGLGEYILYSPLQHGPQAMMKNYFGDQSNHLKAYQTLRRINPTLARVSMTLIPDEPVRYGQPSLASDTLMLNVYQVPQKQFKDTYAEKFLLYKDIVEVEYSANYMDSDSLVKVIKDPSGLYFVHYLIELRKFSVDSFQDKFVTNLKVNGTITDSAEKTIYQFEGSIPFEFNESQLERITYHPFALYDMFPLIPGEYRFSVLLKNEVSKEFTSIERDLLIPEEESSPGIRPLILGYKALSSDKSSLKPFKFGKIQIYSQPRKIFHPQDTLYIGFQLYGLTPDLASSGILEFIINQDTKLQSVHEFSKRIADYKDKQNIHEKVSLAKHSPGYYQIAVRLKNGEDVVALAKERFEITPASAIPRPWVYSKTFPPLSHPGYSYDLGRQYFNNGKTKRARLQFESAFQKMPDSLPITLSLARVYNLEKEYHKIKQILLPFSNLSQPNYDVSLLLCKAHQNLGEFSQAISFYDKAVSSFGVNQDLLNSIGECYFRLKELEEAIAAWERSLELNPNQPEIENKINSIKK